MKKSARFLFLLLMLVVLAAALIVYVSMSARENPRAESPVRISEIMASNKGSVPDENGSYFDYIELYNTSDKEADITGYGLSDDITAGIKYVFPQGTKLGANSRIVV